MTFMRPGFFEARNVTFMRPDFFEAKTKTIIKPGVFEARDGTIVKKTVLFLKVQRDLPLSGGRSRVSMIPVRYATNSRP